jgi:AAA+ ATPase superfamily predicted ATPase
MQDFVGRAAELALLEKQYAGTTGALVPVYGRRRVGKSELILRFLHGKRAVYHVGKTAPGALQLKEFLSDAARVLDEPLLAHVPANDWRAALLATSQRAQGKKLILAFDEFQWSVGASPELPSVLQELWDRLWRGASGIMVILCGSYVGFMEREVLGQKSPLYGRRTAQIHLRPFVFREAAAFHRGYSAVDKAMTYFVCGGIPLYLRHFDRRRSVESNIETLILDEFGPLAREPDFLLREELRDVQSYYAVLWAIAEGRSSVKEIAAASGLPERSLPYYLQQLCELGYVARTYPLSGVAAASRHVRFVLEDPLLRFWFRFVFPNQSLIQQLGPARALREHIRPMLAAYFGGCYERVCREALAGIYEREGVRAGFRVGEYWDKTTQIDVVGVRDDGWIDLGECKWGQVRSFVALAQELEAKVARFPNPANATVGRRLFVRAKSKRGDTSCNGARVHDIEELLG